ncbi:MAG: stage V sporulation protein S [Candidatus Woesearchaeota archaeon]
MTKDNQHPEGEILKVAAKSNPNSLAGAIAGVLEKESKVELQAVGAGAINQAVKGIAIARGYVAPGGVDLICIPGFIDIEIEGKERTAIKFIVKPYARH